jgi:hypothetical protein
VSLKGGKPPVLKSLWLLQGRFGTASKSFFFSGEWRLGITSFKPSDKFNRLRVLLCVGFTEQSFIVGIVLNKLNLKLIDRVYPSLTFKRPQFAHRVCLYFIWLSHNGFVPLNSSNRLVFVLVDHCASCEVATGFFKRCLDELCASPGPLTWNQFASERSSYRLNRSMFLVVFFCPRINADLIPKFDIVLHSSLLFHCTVHCTLYRWATRHVLTRAAKWIDVDGGIFENVLH